MYIGDRDFLSIGDVVIQLILALVFAISILFIVDFALSRVDTEVLEVREKKHTPRQIGIGYMTKSRSASPATHFTRAQYYLVGTLDNGKLREVKVSSKVHKSTQVGDNYFIRTRVGGLRKK